MFEKQPTQPPIPEQKKKEKKKELLGRQIARRGFAKIAELISESWSLSREALTRVTRATSNKEVSGTLFDDVRELEDAFWLSIIEHVSRKDGQDLTPQDVRAHLITKLFNIPQGWTSGIATEEVVQPDGTVEQKRTAPELDKLVATHFTNRTVTVGEIDDGQPIISTDFRDFPDIEQTLASFKEQVSQLPSERGGELGVEIYSILEKEYAHLTNIDNPDDADVQRDCPIEFAYLPGGVPLFLRGYRHAMKWQETHGTHLAETYKNATYVAIESGGESPIGEGLEFYWSNPLGAHGHYDALMKELVDQGFSGMFMDVDARDEIKVCFEPYFCKEGGVQTQLPDIYYKHYYRYLQKENPRLTKKIKTVKNFKKALLNQSRVMPTNAVTSAQKWYGISQNINDNLTFSSLPTGNELGQRVFSDAMAALKLHILAQKMNEGIIKKGVIVDFDGAAHISMKNFYLKYPQYAAEVVLRTINEVLAGDVGEDMSFEDFVNAESTSDILNKAIEILNKPEWRDVVAQISRIPMAYVEDDPHKTTAIGPNQKEMIRNDELNTGLDVLQDPIIVRALCDDAYIQSQIDRVRTKNNK